jgi:hypothetical protein
MRDEILSSKALTILLSTADARASRVTLDALPTTIKSYMAADKPEVITTSVVY